MVWLTILNVVRIVLILKDKLIDLPGSDAGSSPSIMYINSL